MHLAHNQTDKTYHTALTTITTTPRAERTVWRQTHIATCMVVALLIIVCLEGILATQSFANGASDATSSAAPDFSLPSISDREQAISLADYRGRTVYLDFWSSWCLPCRDSLPLLGQLQADFAGEPFAVVTVNLDSYPRDGRSLMKEFGIDFPVASDIAWIVAKQFGLETLPAAFLINGAGQIRLDLPRLHHGSYDAIATVISSEINASRGAEEAKRG